MSISDDEGRRREIDRLRQEAHQVKRALRAAERELVEASFVIQVARELRAHRLEFDSDFRISWDELHRALRAYDSQYTREALDRLEPKP